MTDQAPTRSDLINMLADMTALTKLKYGHLDPDVWGLIQRAESMIEAGRKAGDGIEQASPSESKGLRWQNLNGLPVNHGELVKYLAAMSELKGFQESVKYMGGEANLRELVELGRLEAERDRLISSPLPLSARREIEDRLRVRKEATYDTKWKEGRYTVAVSKILGHGYFERDDGNVGGGLWFDHAADGGLALRDYDGVTDCPKDVARALSDMGVDVSYLNDDLDEVATPPAAQSDSAPRV